MPWFDLLDELAELDCDPQWNAAKDVAFLQNALFGQIGAETMLDDHDVKPANVVVGGASNQNGNGGSA